MSESLYFECVTNAIACGVRRPSNARARPMPPRRARATPTLATVQPQQPQAVWLESIVDAWACYLADLLALRCSFFVRKGGLVRWVGEDPPVFKESLPRCHSCKAPIETRHVLCEVCRRESPIVEHGPTLANVMQRCSNDEYVLDDTKKQVIRALHVQQELAFDATILANTLSSWCYDEHKAYREAAEDATGNVPFDRAFVDNGGSYDQTVMCGLVESLVPVGGLGVALRDQIMKLADEWLMNVDKQIRQWFGIPISADAVEAAVVESHVHLFAKQIANRVALLEPTDEEHTHKSEILCVDNLEHRAEVQYVNEKLLAEAQCRTDCHSMAVLAKIARHGIGAAEQWRALSSPNMRRPLTDLLKAPPPELLKELRSVAQDMASRCCATSSATPPRPEGRPRSRASTSGALPSTSRRCACSLSARPRRSRDGVGRLAILSRPSRVCRASPRPRACSFVWTRVRCCRRCRGRAVEGSGSWCRERSSW